jgi:hypothetical protein
LLNQNNYSYYPTTYFSINHLFNLERKKYDFQLKNYAHVIQDFYENFIFNLFDLNNYKIKVKTTKAFQIGDVFNIYRPGSLNFYATVMDDSDSVNSTLPILVTNFIPDILEYSILFTSSDYYGQVEGVIQSFDPVISTYKVVNAGHLNIITSLLGNGYPQNAGNMLFSFQKNMSSIMFLNATVPNVSLTPFILNIKAVKYPSPSY